MINIIQHSQRILPPQQRPHRDGVAVDFGGQRFIQHHAVLPHQRFRLVGGAHRVEKAQHHRARRHQTQRRRGHGEPPAAQNMGLGAARQHFLAQCCGFLRRQGVCQRRVVIHPAFQFGHRSALLQ